MDIVVDRSFWPKLQQGLEAAEFFGGRRYLFGVDQWEEKVSRVCADWEGFATSIVGGQESDRFSRPTDFHLDVYASDWWQTTDLHLVDCVEPLGVTELTIRGRNFSAPARPRACVEKLYGAEWRIPKRALAGLEFGGAEADRRMNKLRPPYVTRSCFLVQPCSTAMLCRAPDRRGSRALLAGATGALLLYQQSLAGQAPVNFVSVAAPSLGRSRSGVSQRLSTSRPRLDLSSRNVDGAPVRRPWGILLGLCFGSMVFFSSAKVAAAAGAARPHLGVRLAMQMKACFAIPDWAILMLLSALPLVELRGGVPVGLWMGLAVPQVMLLCILGNMIPIPLLLAALRSERIKKLLTPLLNRAAQKTEPIGAHDRWVGIAAFVGVPLPGTGAWTGAMVAYLLGMDLGEAITSVLAGVVVAACIMASLTLAGWYGCAVMVLVGIVALVSRWLQMRKG
eukprot:symbB.v1.2.010738.t1/scaffold708.1/size170785/6